MGLDTTHDAWHGPYSRFNQWRDHVAQKAEYSFEGNTFNSNEVKGIWEATPPDALTVLMRHSDCDGVIQVAQMQPLIDRLKGIFPAIVDDYFINKTREFIAGLKKALEKNEDIEFQ